MQTLPRVRIVPLPDRRVSFQVDGQERLSWWFSDVLPRPCFFPFRGPSGESLTRMGHPGAPNHDHHQSIWFAHHKALGIDFWGNSGPGRIRQQGWLVYEDGPDRACMAVQLHWFDGHNPRELLEQTLIAILRPGPDGETLLELQSTFTPVADTFEFQQTNFGFLAVRVAASLSEHFGAGRLTNSDGVSGENNGAGRPAVFGSQARWVDYSGPVATDQVEGITFHDHPDNPRYPTHWHVRSDGWMGASACMHGPLVATQVAPLRLRYLLHAHAGPCQSERWDSVARDFATWPRFEVAKSMRPHHQFELREA